MKILIRILFILIIFGTIGTMFIGMTTTSGQEITFTYLMQVIQAAPNITIDLDFLNISIGSDWGIFNFLREFINSLVGVATFGAWLCLNFIQIMIYLIYFVKSIFVGL